jgi:hypothetical protein
MSRVVFRSIADSGIKAAVSACMQSCQWEELVQPKKSQSSWQSGKPPGSKSNKPKQLSGINITEE